MDMNKEMENWEGLVELVVKKMIKKNRGLSKYKDDLVGEGYLGLAKAIETYENDRGMTKASYYSLKIRGFVKDYIKRETKLVLPSIDIDNIASYTPSVEEELIRKEEKDLEDKIDSFIVSFFEPEDHIDRRVYHDLILGSYLTQREVAEELGVSVSVIKQRKRRILNHLKKLAVELKIINPIGGKE